MSLKKSYSIDYAITLTLKPQWRQCTPHTQVEAALQEAIKIFSCNNMKVTLIYELTKSDDIHFHGVCSVPLQKHIRDYQIWIRNRFRKNKLFGFMYIKPIDDMNVWKEYISKDFENTKFRMGINPLQIDNYELFPNHVSLQDQGFIDKWNARNVEWVE